VVQCIFVVFVVVIGLFLLLVGVPCENLTIAKSNMLKQTGVFEDRVTVQCNKGYHIINVTDPFLAVCQSDQTWNTTVTECTRRSLEFLVYVSRKSS